MKQSELRTRIKHAQSCRLIAKEQAKQTVLAPVIYTEKKNYSINLCITLNLGFFGITDHKSTDLLIYSKIYLTEAAMDLDIRINGQLRGRLVFKEH